MVIHTDAANTVLKEDLMPTVVALGYFDGIHIGHQRLISAAVKIATDKGYKSLVHTFDRQPRVGCNHHAACDITPMNIKKEIIGSMGVDILAIDIFDEKYMHMEAGDFVRNVVLKNLGAKEVVVGYDYTFGRDRLGNPEILKSILDLNHVGLTVIDRVCVDGQTVSSSKVRALIAQGEMEKVHNMLSRYYELKGEVIRGRHVGSAIGTPTVNLETDSSCLLPPFGVYVTRVTIENKLYFGVTNLGLRPTFGNFDKPTAETYIFDFEGKLYGQHISVEFLTMLRREIKFPDIKSLTDQINKDKIDAKAYIQKKLFTIIFIYDRLF